MLESVVLLEDRSDFPVGDFLILALLVYLQLIGSKNLEADQEWRTALRLEYFDFAHGYVQHSIITHR